MVEPEGGYLVKKAGLTEADLAVVRQLAEVCQTHDGVELKVNWTFLYNRQPGETGDFFYYVGDKPVAYLELDGFGSKFEATGLVLPEYRRRGIFRALLTSAMQESRERKAASLLLVCYRAAEAGAALARSIGGTYHSSEYHMQLETAIPPPGFDKHSELSLEPATLNEAATLAELMAINFGKAMIDGVAQIVRDMREGRRFFLAKRHGEAVGELGVSLEQGEIYIAGVGIVPQYRGHGYGRQILASAVQQMQAEGHTHFALDVLTENSNALSLYQSCGFIETNVYDYYTLSI